MSPSRCNMMVAVTGVSGSGKSTLVHDVIYQSLQQRLRQPAPEGEWEESLQKTEKITCRRVERAELLREVILVDQSPIGRTPRSNPVTYIKAFDLIRETLRVHAGCQEARLQRRAFFVQHSRRPLRELPGRRHRDGGDAVPGRRRAGVRGVQRHALQEQHSGYPLPGAEHS